ncbi:hypothetical protein RRG08_039725 [Elysia crispata]|uniref:Uncharacterized protein n=1 Tax=Elysia crispata TaxID=231223 RepID=A0AAE0YA24_9GAST|nr:hypothetical protein RRG08_039725 [Elysia crispata]
MLVTHPDTQCHVIVLLNIVLAAHSETVLTPMSRRQLLSVCALLFQVSLDSGSLKWCSEDRFSNREQTEDLDTQNDQRCS